MAKVIIIGSGLGGMSTALRLQYLGFEVTVLEKQTRIGGRSNLIHEDGYRVDTGPTILVMRDSFDDFYTSIGQSFEERIQVKQLDPNYRIYFHDNTFLDLTGNMAELARNVEKLEPGSAEKVFEFLGDGARKYRLGMPFVSRNYDRISDLANPIAGWRLFRTKAHQNLYQQVSTYFQDDRLRKAFSFHPMFLGLSPFDSLAMYSLISYADLALGMWYPIGGIYSIVEDMQRLAEEMGVEIRVNCPIDEILVLNNQVKGVRTADGEIINADLIVSNADLPYTYNHLLRKSNNLKRTKNRIRKMKISCSGFLLYLGINRIYPDLKHQGIYFSEDYTANLSAIFDRMELPEDPSFHINVPTKTDPSLAPHGHTIIYILAPMPNLRAGIDWQKASPLVCEQLITSLEKIVDNDIRQHIVWKRQYTPEDFESDYNAVDGTAFGSLSHNFFQTAYFRPHNHSNKIKGLYFVGQGTYPGIGMPMVMTSSRLTTERILKENPDLTH